MSRPSRQLNRRRRVCDRHGSRQPGAARRSGARITQDSGGTESMGMSTEFVPVAGATTLGWTQTGINRTPTSSPRSRLATSRLRLIDHDPRSRSHPYNAAILPASIAGTSADAGGSGVSTVQVAIQDGAGNYWGGATFNQASIFYNTPRHDAPGPTARPSSAN